jgi:hypothetical protein
MKIQKSISLVTLLILLANICFGQPLQIQFSAPVLAITYDANFNVAQSASYTNSANVFKGSFGGNGILLTNLNPSSLVLNTNAAGVTNTIVGFFFITNGASVYKIPVCQ